MQRNWTAIRSFALYRKYSKVYNLRVKANNAQKTLQSLNVESIFKEQTAKFKVQASLGYILYNNSNKSMRYEPMLIENQEDYNSFIDQLSEKDFVKNATKNRPNTSFSFHLLTNITIYVYPIPEHPIGCPIILPDYIKKNKAIISADVNSNGRPYQNNLCFFRALALFRKQTATLEKSVKLYFDEYLKALKLDKKQFKGITLPQLPQVERLFKISISVFTLEELDSGEICAKLLSKPSTKYSDRLNLQLYENHFSWIKNLGLYTKPYKCNYCSKLLKSYKSLNAHSISCSSVTKYVYPSGVYSPNETIFEKLNNIGVMVDKKRQHYPYFAVFDCETYLDTQNLPKATSTIQYTAEHKLASVSVCTNIPGYEVPLTYLNDQNDEYDVVKRMMSYLDLLSDVCYNKLLDDYKDVFEQINEVKLNHIERETRAMSKKGVENVTLRFTKLEKDLQMYLKDLLVFGFQSKGFDIPVMKEHIVKYLIETSNKINLVIKKGSKYMTLQTDRLRFLDISNYLPQGVSLSDYLKAMEVETPKFFWIYEKFTSMDLLKQTKFPEHDDFYSTLKQKNISVEDYNYAKSIWKKNGMKTLRDMLIYYNEQDVKPLCAAIEKQYQFFKSRDLDFKTAISISGMSIKYLFQLKTKQDPIFMFGNKFSNLHHLVRANIRGGLSLVFHRHQEKDATKIKSRYFKSSAKTTKICEGWDCNAMYLHNLAMCDMPTGAFVRRHRQTGFRIEKSYNKGVKATQWIIWIGKVLSVEFQHMFNGNEKRLGGRNIPVDGYARLKDGSEIVLNFSGCWYHSHLCEFSPKGKHLDHFQDLENQLTTYQNLKYLQDLGYKVYHIWECEFEKQKSQSKEMFDFCKNLSIEVDNRYMISENQILEEVENEKLFGMIEVDIHTPKKYKRAYSEFQPITKHAMLTRDDIGEHMKEFAENNSLLKRPTKTLLNSYYATKILLATPLLRWYLQHGLKCTKVYQVIQYKPSKCFLRFAKEVVKARIEGDQDPCKKIISDNCKLIGNSAYGRTLLRAEEYRDVSFYSSSSVTIANLINNKKFRNIDEIGENLIEIENAKSRVRLNVPIQLGFFVLEYAKLLLLRFYYDFLIKFLDFDTFSLIHCDTDSLYLSLSKDNIYATIKQCMRKEFIEEHDQWLVRLYCKTHKADFFHAVFSNKEWKPKECCQKVFQYYLRQPGLFHLENVSTGIIALTSKSYYCYGNKPKFSCKGISRVHNNLTELDYKNVLFNKTHSMAINRGMRIKGKKMFTYAQRKKGLNYMYGKRRVLSDSVTTKHTLL